MKKIIYSFFVVSALLLTASCESNLDIEQKGVTAIENFYKTDADAESALIAAYKSFNSNTVGRGSSTNYTPYKFMLNGGGDDFYLLGKMALTEYRFDSGLDVLLQFYNGLYQSIYADNLVIDHFKNGLPDGTKTAVTKRVVAEARVLRAYNHFLLAVLWGNPPFVDHVLNADDMPYNCDKDPKNPMTHDELILWVASECEEAAADLNERTSISDKNGCVVVTKGFAYALAGKAYLFAKQYDKAYAALDKVVKSGKYKLIPGEDFWQNFHIEGDCNSEKVFETNIEENADYTVRDYMGMTTWMESQSFGWGASNFVVSPDAVYSGLGGWGNAGVPQEFGEEFLANDGHSYRFDASLITISDAVYNMPYNNEELNKMTLEEKKASKRIGIRNVKDGYNRNSIFLPFKPLTKKTDCINTNMRLNNNVVMRYAEVLLLYAEAALQTNHLAEAKTAINDIQVRAGSKTISETVNMDVLKKEKKYELWFEGSRMLDLKRWGDLDVVKTAGQNIARLFDKLYRAPQATDENVRWENGTEAESRFYVVKTHQSIDQGYVCGYKENKHEYYPYPQTVVDKNPNLVQNPGY